MFFFFVPYDEATLLNVSQVPSSRLQLQGVWETIESNMEVFNVKKLPLMLVPFLDLSTCTVSSFKIFCSEHHAATGLRDFYHSLTMHTN